MIKRNIRTILIILAWILFGLLVIWLWIDDGKRLAALQIEEQEAIQKIIEIDSPVNKPSQVELTDQAELIEWDFDPQYSFEFWDKDNKRMGRIWFCNGVMKFDGAMEESAKLFFRRFLKPIVDAYIKEKLEVYRSELVTKAVIMRRADFLPFIHHVFNKEINNERQIYHYF